jgi:hypothetical protein
MYYFEHKEQMYYLERYLIDWNKVQTLDDMKRLIAAVNISFEPNNPNIESIKDLVRLEKKGWPMGTMD